jgi:hypothetical protein
MHGLHLEVHGPHKTSWTVCFCLCKSAQTVRSLSGLKRHFFVLLRFQMYPFEFLTPKPTWLEFNWAYLIGLTWLTLRKEIDFKTWGKWDELWEFWEMKELCWTKMLWLINLAVRWYVWIFWWCARTWDPTFV